MVIAVLVSLNSHNALHVHHHNVLLAELVTSYRMVHVISVTVGLIIVLNVMHNNVQHVIQDILLRMVHVGNVKLV